jgi:hypothetical protein
VETCCASGLAQQPGGTAFLADDPAPPTCHHHTVLVVPAHGDGSGSGNEADLVFVAERRRQELGVVDNLYRNPRTASYCRLKSIAVRRVVATMCAHSTDLLTIGDLARQPAERRGTLVQISHAPVCGWHDQVARAPEHLIDPEVRLGAADVDADIHCPHLNDPDRSCFAVQDGSGTVPEPRGGTPFASSLGTRHDKPFDDPTLEDQEEDQERQRGAEVRCYHHVALPLPWGPVASAGVRLASPQSPTPRCNAQHRDRQAGNGGIPLSADDDPREFDLHEGHAILARAGIAN